MGQQCKIKSHCLSIESSFLPSHSYKIFASLEIFELKDQVPVTLSRKSECLTKKMIIDIKQIRGKFACFEDCLKTYIDKIVVKNFVTSNR